jgi:transposase-like protein
MEQALEPRIVRGYSILAKGDEPQRLDEQTYVIPSQSGNGKYFVKLEGSEWSCTCPDHTYRNVECKHIHAVRFWLSLKRKMNEEGVFDIHERIREKPSCVYCSSLDVVANGNRNGINGVKQRFLCKTCNHTFVQDNGFERNPKIISLALDLYFKGISLRKVVDHLNQFYSIKVHHSTVLRWIQKYTKIINRYVEKLQPNVSEVWHVVPPSSNMGLPPLSANYAD